MKIKILFSAGKVFLSNNFENLLDSKDNDIEFKNVLVLIDKHQSGDFGDVSEELIKENIDNIEYKKGYVKSIYLINKKAGINLGNEAVKIFITTNLETRQTKIDMFSFVK